MFALNVARANGPSCRIFVFSFPGISETRSNLDSASPLRVAFVVLLFVFLAIGYRSFGSRSQHCRRHNLNDHFDMAEVGCKMLIFSCPRISDILQPVSNSLAEILGRLISIDLEWLRATCGSLDDGTWLKSHWVRTASGGKGGVLEG